MDDEYHNSKKLSQEPGTEQVNDVQTVSEVSDDISSFSPESVGSPIDSENTLPESSDTSETVATYVDSTPSPSESPEIASETVATSLDSLSSPSEMSDISMDYLDKLTASLENHEGSADSSLPLSSLADDSVVSLDGDSSEADVLKPGEVADRDDYCSEEPPKLKYYDEAERQEEINKYQKFKKVDGETYRKVNVFLRKRTYITAREWALARLCADFKTPYGSEMTFIGEHLPELCPFMQEPYSPQAVNQARTSFKRKVRKSAATFLYGAMCGFFTPEELDDILFEANEVSKFFLEIEGTSLELDEEIDIEDKISAIMKGLGSSARSILKTRMADDDVDDEVIVVPVEESVKESKSVESEGELINTETEVTEEEKKPLSSEKEEDTFHQ